MGGISPLTSTGLFRWMLVLFLVSLAFLTISVFTLRRDIALAHAETVTLSENMAWFAGTQLGVQAENEALVKQRNALEAYVVYLSRENDEMYKRNEELLEGFKKLRNQSRQ